MIYTVSVTPAEGAAGTCARELSGPPRMHTFYYGSSAELLIRPSSKNLCFPIGILILLRAPDSAVPPESIWSILLKHYL